MSRAQQAILDEKKKKEAEAMKNQIHPYTMPYFDTVVGKENFMY